MSLKIPDKLDPDFEPLLLESMADGVFTLNSNGEFTYWNPAMERITGYRATEAIGQSCALLNFNRCFQKACPTGIKECGIYQQERIDGKECFLKHKNGHDVPVIKSARILKDKEGKVRGVVETVTDLTELYQARREAEKASQRMGEIYRFDKIIGKSNPMQRVFATIRAAAGSDATILIQGESGSGKELVAGAVHYNSNRAEMPFVTVNSSALSESLLESELFGHAKGSFTGAMRDRMGRFEEAEGGTLFLDEIGDLSPFIQVKLLRVLQEREFERVGECKKRKLDIRIITATNRNLYQLVTAGNFREDLFYRLKVFPINLPPLRNRREDIPLLISHFIEKQNAKTGKRISGVTHQAMRILLDYNWPGNVRELENAIEHAFVLCEKGEIDLFELPVEIRQMEYRLENRPGFQPEGQLNPHGNTGRVINPAPHRKKPTRELLLQTLAASNWNKAEVARRLGYSRAAIWKYMKKWNVPLTQSEYDDPVTTGG
jgi:PAS domain S-box-containing protein